MIVGKYMVTIYKKKSRLKRTPTTKSGAQHDKWKQRKKGFEKMRIQVSRN